MLMVEGTKTTRDPHSENHNSIHATLYYTAVIPYSGHKYRARTIVGMLRKSLSALLFRTSKELKVGQQLVSTNLELLYYYQPVTRL